VTAIDVTWTVRTQDRAVSGWYGGRPGKPPGTGFDSRDRARMWPSGSGTSLPSWLRGFEPRYPLSPGRGSVVKSAARARACADRAAPSGAVPYPLGRGKRGTTIPGSRGIHGPGRRGARRHASQPGLHEGRAACPPWHLSTSPAPWDPRLQARSTRLWTGGATGSCAASSVVEQPTLNRRVGGSSPSRRTGVKSPRTGWKCCKFL